MVIRMQVHYDSGKVRDLVGTRTLSRYLWHIGIVEVRKIKDVWEATFVSTRVVFTSTWDDRCELWDWLHSRRTLKGTGVRWLDELYIADPKHVGKYPW